MRGSWESFWRLLLPEGLPRVADCGMGLDVGEARVEATEGERRSEACGDLSGDGDALDWTVSSESAADARGGEE